MLGGPARLHKRTQQEQRREADGRDQPGEGGALVRSFRQQGFADHGQQRARAKGL